MSPWLQSAAVALLLAWSLLVLARRFFPGTAAAVQGRLAAGAERQGHARLARWLRPAPAGAGCDHGCQSCHRGCAASPQAPAPVQWRPPAAGGR